jgi:hypothetical protein
VKRFFKRLWEDIQHGENIDLLATIVLVFVITILNGLGIASLQLVSSTTMAVLGLIAIGLLITRYKLDEIHRRENSENAINFYVRKPLSEIFDQFSTEKEIWMLGLTLRGTTTENFHNFKSRAERGVKFRVLIVNANKVDMQHVVKQFSRGGNEEQFRADFAQTLNQYREIRQIAKNADNVQVRLLNFIPAFSLYIFPRTLEGGIIFAEIYGYKSLLGSVPKFRLTEHDNLDWYKHFLTQFEVMWKDAEQVAL